ncbi:hypothetical protein T484DRAFT_1981375 [Baffinella frigidus]|nr:hypothetical protein T484DRAFT_1981375 [Cryptophyta sp. CCMP2293]|mmetsp:Transcript_50518/g.120200  ORF Transcript_50518/g.120200 Transcript_50518/m.120200 type:complete len:414 (-) Transcript_50518:114-1355(-)|eukprot:CAMPEP_0180124734 /NCGR_PEP_ID=MMETSP0986-20121125/4810_1 /TAXON_ID=697907 /ORGANISM="non described non described, Strain CCMP2293" /LENGTH=413 /DNA_ID=CAMNT_0022064095 /DNA_START=409 /DNA_END=1650 /DNA_ORIENTATION=+
MCRAEHRHKVEARCAKARLVDKDGRLSALRHCVSPYDDPITTRCGNKRGPAATFTHIPILLAALISALVVQPAGDSPTDKGALLQRMSCAAWRRQTRRFHPPGDVHAADFSHHRRDEALEWWGAGAEGGYRETGELTGWWGEDAGSGAVTSWVGSCACSVRGINGTHCAGEDAWLWVDAAGDAVRCHDGLDGLEEPHDDADHSPPGLLSDAYMVALLVRSGFILMELGSRPLRNAKKILSCGLICLWLYSYSFGDVHITLNGVNVSKLQRKVAADNATFVVLLLLLRLATKVAGLLKLFKRFKRFKRFRCVKLVKLTKLAKVVNSIFFGEVSLRLLLKTLRMCKLLKLLKVSRKTKKLLTKQNYKALKVFKAFKLIKVVRLALVVFCIEGAVVPVWGAHLWTSFAGVCALRDV